MGAGVQAFSLRIGGDDRVHMGVGVADEAGPLERGVEVARVVEDLGAVGVPEQDGDGVGAREQAGPLAQGGVAHGAGAGGIEAQ